MSGGQEYILNAMSRLAKSWPIPGQHGKLPEKFKAGEFMMKPTSVLNYVGSLGDVSLKPFSPNAWPTIAEIKSAEHFFYGNAQIKAKGVGELLPTLQVHITAPTSKRGEWVFANAEREVQVFAFVTKWASLDPLKAEEKQIVDKMASAATAVRFELSPRTLTGIAYFWQESALSKALDMTA